MYSDINTHGGRALAVRDFEQKFADLTCSKYALLMNSGTAALHSAFLALGVGPGDEVLVPSYTFFATVSPILQCGATPVFCEIDPRTLTIDPADVAKKVSPRTKAISVVHVWGNPAQMDQLREIADCANLAIVEDCSHAHGATFRDRPVGSWGDIGCFSLQGSKAVSGGEAGVAVTSDAILFDRMLALAHFPRPARDQAADSYTGGPYALGLKYRPHLYATILAQESLKKLPELNGLRAKNLKVLCDELADCSAVRPVEALEGATRGGYLSFLFHYEGAHAGGWNRAAFCRAVQAEGAPLNLDRYSPLHRKPLFASTDLSSFGGALRAVTRADIAELPVTERTCQSLISFPAFTKVPISYIRRCARAVRKVARVAENTSDLRTL